METLLSGAAGIAAIALLNAWREATAGNWKPLQWTLASGLITVALVFLTNVDSWTTTMLTNAFVIGLGGSGLYTASTKVGEKAADRVSENTEA